MEDRRKYLRDAAEAAEKAAKKIMEELRTQATRTTPSDLQQRQTGELTEAEDYKRREEMTMGVLLIDQMLKIIVASYWALDNVERDRPGIAAYYTPEKA